jgi:hypothetical protein
MVRIIATSLLGVLLTAPAALAANDDGAATVSSTAAIVTSAFAERADPAAAALVPRAPAPSVRRPLTLPALYVGSALLQGYDAYSTLTVMKHGGVEVNPLMRGLSKSPAAFIGIKAGVTAMSIMAAERMWKNNNRLGAVLTMVATNGLMAYVATHNARVLAQMR